MRLRNYPRCAHVGALSKIVIEWQRRPIGERIARFGRALGARPETLAGLSGLGDLVLTCSSMQSRNFCFGLALGRGDTRDEASREARGVSEGIWTAEAVVEIARDQGVEVPISEAVHAILEGRLTVEGAIDALMQRPIRSEL